jgi:hypothetical protein
MKCYPQVVRRCFLPEAGAVSRGDRSLRIVASLGTRTPDAWAYRAPDAASLCRTPRIMPAVLATIFAMTGNADSI